ncbi:kinase-like protein, partial [Panus rudis PR-1116 ss-1]
NQRHGRGKILRLLVELSKAANVLPPSLFVGDVICVNREVVACGGYADIFRAERNGIAVALKKLRVTQRWETVKSSVSFHLDSSVHWLIRMYVQTFFRETLYWQCLKHEHILPFLGVDCITFVPYSCMVSPWMKYGNINQCMDTLESMNQELPLKLWMYQIGLGLQYLHSENVVHGDLRGANILIDDELSVKLCDFGLAHFVDTSSASPGSYTGGACRWMSPSILRGGRPNYSSDIYAFGCVWLETHTRRAPFSNLSEHHMISKVLEGTRP